ncbi:MAG: WecB/TagA/CpsF family glycosyltransferase [Candidatus Heteroscillospira sp.]|jgi:N-acetylglucosaminyldiphosphoundecaprenol N-acetyl-beta-D-mannosaminyltransferase
MRTDILGVGYDDLTMEEAVVRALELMDSRKGAYVVTPNPEIIMLARENPALAEAIAEASLVLADGVGVTIGAKILSRPMKGRVPGIDFASRLMDEMASRGGSVFLFGAKPGVAEKAAEELASKHPGLVIAGTNDGYFKDDAPIIEKINAAAPDLLLVCLGAPKQELWMQKNAPALNVGLMAGLGGSLDVFAGNVQRAPERWRKMGLEWLYRLMKEPSRLGRMMKLPKFVLVVTGQRIRGK